MELKNGSSCKDMKAMVTKPLQDGVDKLAEMLSMIPY